MKHILILFGTALFALLPSNPALAKQTTQATTTVQKHTLQSQWPPETLTGTIAAVDLAKHIVVVYDSNGTPFDFVVTPSTRIQSGAETLRISDLSSKTSDKVSVRYVPERKGDIGKLISLNQ